MALHLLYNPLRFTALAGAFRKGDALIIFDQAIEQWADLDLAAAEILWESVFALNEECLQKALDSAIDGVTKISYTDWVALTIQHPQQVNWI
ncbi:MAG: hypothetical protein P8O91_08920 [Luminiphilus sp.]|nr:hypothetical protein [Luminiphilus sp.]